MVKNKLELTKKIVLNWVEELLEEIQDNFVLDGLTTFSEMKDSLESWDTGYHLWNPSSSDYNTLCNFLKLGVSGKTEIIDSITTELNYELSDDGTECEDINNFVSDFFTKKLKEFSKNNNNSSNGKNNKMLKKITDTVINDGQEVALRLAAKQLAKSFQEPICGFLIGKLGLENNIESKNKVLSVLQSDIGLGMISMGLSLGVGSLPLPENIKDQVGKLTKELRIMGEMSVSEPIVEMFVAPLRMMLTDQVLSIPLLQNQMTNQLPPAKIEMQEVQAEVVKIKKSPKPKVKSAK